MFTGQYRDSESSLDYFGARYLSSAQGRFTSPDDPFADQDASDPQSWNLLAYARNNPLIYTDPTGNATSCWTGLGFNCQSVAPVQQVDTSVLWDLLMGGVNTNLVGPTLQMGLNVWNFISQPRNPGCLAAATAAGTMGGSAVGAVAGGGVLSVPGSALGFGIGGGVGYGVGMISCMSNNGATEGGGGPDAEPQTQMVKTSELKTTHKLTLSRRAFARLKASIAKEGINDPIKYVEFNGEKYVVDGHHRLAAARQLGQTEVPAERVTLPFRGYITPSDLF